MDLVGKILAERYEIREEIGKGGMAHVYKAWCKMLNRFVAIKALKEEYKDDNEFVRRFNVEAQAAASISNPHVVSIYDVGYEDGIYYIVMEYVEGITLKEYIAEKGVLPWREAATYAAQICDGLSAAHKNKVIHRDIKPQNIILTPDGTLKVTDFGIARATTEATMTMGNNAIGTVHYLSPEQARGGYTDERTDIYSLGVVLYEMLTGRLPFVDDSPVAVAIKHIQESPTPLRELNADIPEAMEKVVLCAMNKEQGVRYPSAEAFLKDIERVLENPNIIARKATDDSADDGLTVEMKKIGNDDIEDYENKIKQEELKKRKDTEGRKLREIDERRDRRAAKRKERRVTMIAMLSAILVIVGLGWFFSSITDGFGFFAGSEKIDVPNIVNMDIEKARNQYKDKFNIIEVEKRASDKSIGAILEQNPAAGEKVSKSNDNIIKVVVSSGSDSTRLVSVLNMKKDAAKDSLVKLGFQVNIKEEFSDSVAKDEVIAQEPQAGSKVSEGAMITIIVSKGSEDGEDKEDEDKPKATATKKPEASSTPKPSEEPKETKEPESTKKPESTQAPAKTEAPAKTNAPAKTEAPKQPSSNSGGNSGTASGAPGLSD